MTSNLQIHMKCLVNSKWQLTASEFRTQIAKLHHQVVECKVAHCTSLHCSFFFLVFSCCFILLISVLKLRCFPLCLSLDCHFFLYFALYFTIPDPSLLCHPSHFLFFILFFLFHPASILEKKGYIRRKWRLTSVRLLCFKTKVMLMIFMRLYDTFMPYSTI